MTYRNIRPQIISPTPNLADSTFGTSKFQTPNNLAWPKLQTPNKQISTSVPEVKEFSLGIEQDFEEDLDKFYLLFEWEIWIWPKVNSDLSKTHCVSDFSLQTCRHTYKFPKKSLIFVNCIGFQLWKLKMF